MIGKPEIILLAGLIPLIAGCSRGDQSKTSQAQGTAWASGSFDTNGKRIYFTGTSNRGTPISYTGGPTMYMMMGGRLACVSCHGIAARGGLHAMHMSVMNAPDIRWSVLSGEHHEEEGSDEHHHHEAYDFDSFKNAVEHGADPDGDALNPDMPRWQMSDSDLHDLVKYLKSLP
jgi:cytochrome c oxidase subunit 2